MDDMSLIYNINLCRICQVPANLDLVSTSTTTGLGTTYLDLLKFIFHDIPWIDDTLLSLACHTCVKKIEDTAEFKNTCLESNKRRAGLDAGIVVKLEIEEIKIDDAITEDEAANEIMYTDNDDAEVKVMADEQSAKFKKELPVNFEKTALRPVRSKTNTKHIELTPPIAKRVQNESLRKGPETINEPYISANDVLNNLIELNRKGRGKARASKNHHCDICQMEFKYLEDFDRHIHKHNGTRNYICTVCGRTYITRDDLKQHSYRHNAEAMYPCEECPNRKYKTAKDLRTHKKIVHTNREDFKYLCTECDSKFPQSCALKTHVLRRHSKIRPFKCDMCDKSFAEKRDLQHHHVTHSNVRAFKCDLCPAEYKRKDVLLNHKTKHHGVGNYKFHVEKKCECTYCGKIISKDKLKRHIRTHTGVKPYNCRLCNMKFICNSYVKGHLKLKHDFDIEANDFDVKLYYDVCEDLNLENTVNVTNEDTTTPVLV